MANVSRVNGFRPIKYLNGAKYNGVATEYFIPNSSATAVFVGDLVKLDTTGDTSATGGLDKGIRSVVPISSATDAVVGVVIGFKIDPTNLNTPQYRAASTGRYVLVVDDPNVLFEAQANAAVSIGSVGLNASPTIGAGSTTTGASGHQVDVSTAATTATLSLKIMELTQRVDNEVNATANKVVVKLNNHQLNASTGTAGV